jgi:hypothetical protein
MALDLSRSTSYSKLVPSIFEADLTAPTIHTTKKDTMTVSRRTLKILAGVVWHIGGIVLLIKAGTLLLEADSLRPGQNWQWIFVVVGLILGTLKARYLFSKSCRKNLIRIETLDQPHFWRFFRPRFFVLLAIMILTGITLSRLAEGHYGSLIGVGTLDLTLAIALLGSSIVFWQQRAFAYASESSESRRR